MIKKILLVFIVIILFLLALAGVYLSKQFENTPADEVSSEIEQSDISMETTVEGKAIWQDPNNIVVIWETEQNCKYKVLRSSSRDGEYSYVGESQVGSYRDNTVKYPENYFYKIERTNYLSKQVELSEPIGTVVDSEALSSVSVIMYHNFVSEEDVKNGIEYEEYSISPEDFEEDLIWLKNNGYITITSDELLEFLEKKEALPSKAVVISIDDGSWGVYKHAWPLLKKHGMKADLNVIGAQIDATWETLNSGKTRDGEAAPFCTWEELAEMQKSGVINICSHTYGLHVYNKDKRIGMNLMENETEEEFTTVVKEDYNLSVKCIRGWVGKAPKTVAYPYSKRCIESDNIILSNTGYEILMAGEGARGTVGNYFVTDCDISNQLMLISRTCRMDGTPISVYLERIEREDNNGIN
jgi:peptidoglycan/xylan/chitin deacetylase (PgdA/CDA1 family)